jgi:F-type H+-transporting ATPase subunit epsilon
MAVKLPENIELEIVTPDSQLFVGSVDEVTLPGINGYMGILPGHAPLLSELRIGIISCRSQSETHRFFCSWGFVEVLGDKVSVLAEIAQKPEQIDVDKAREDKEKAEELLRSKDSGTDVKSAMELWESAVTRLQVTGKQT